MPVVWFPCKSSKLIRCSGKFYNLRMAKWCKLSFWTFQEFDKCSIWKFNSFWHQPWRFQTIFYKQMSISALYLQIVSPDIFIIQISTRKKLCNHKFCMHKIYVTKKKKTFMYLIKTCSNTNHLKFNYLCTSKHATWYIMIII